MADNNEKKHAACKECREKKLKCLPSEEADDSCQRCARLGRDCQLPEARQRKRKARLRGRVEQLESSYSEILSLLKQAPQHDANARTTVSASTPSLAGTSRLSHTGLKSPPYSDTTQPEVPGNYSHEIPSEECDILLNDYRRMSTNNFPYVIIPDPYPATTLVLERPMLAQAIFIATTWRLPDRQRALKDKFLRDFTERYFIKSERSLDLLQAMIVYFGWCHWYTIPVATQVYRLGSLVVSLAVELGLHQKPTSITQHQMIVGHDSALEPGNETSSSKFWGIEARRAYIGAYTISTYGLLLFKRATMLPYTQYLEDCAFSLATDPQHRSDTTLIHGIRSLRLAEETTYTFDHGSKEKIGELSDEKIQILVRALSKQIEAWSASVPAGISDSGRTYRSYHSSRMYLYEVGLYGLLQGQPPSVARVSILYECFNATMKYLSCVLEIGVDEMADWSSLDWRGVNFGIMLSTKSSIILDSAYVSTEASQRAEWLGKCLDTFCLRAQELNRLKGEDCSYFLKLAHEWANIKTYHQNCVLKTFPTTAMARPEQNQPQMLSQPRQQNGNTAYMETAFDLDPFNELFWAGFEDPEAGMPSIYPM